MSDLRAMDVARFRKVCGLLGSDQAGERSAAALKATAMLKDAGLTRDDVGAGVPSAIVHDALMWKQMAEMWKSALDREKERFNRAQREVNRLKGIWPNGKPPRGSKKPAEVDLDWRKS